MTTLIRKWLPGQEAVRLFVTGWLGRHVPRSSRLTHMTGSMLVSAFSFQLLTGLCLWTVYSPSSQTAWESVFYIQNEVTLGWLVRGMHHFMAQAMMFLLALHFLVVVYSGRYRPPKSMSYWSGMALLFLVLAMGFTGYLLVWDQRGRAASGVATNLMAATPMVGQYVQTMAIGGQDFGHATLTRFLALHAGLIPSLIALVIGIHGVLTAAARTRMARERAEERAEAEEQLRDREAASPRPGDRSTPEAEDIAELQQAATVHPDDLFRPWWPNQAVWDFAGGTVVLLIVFLITIHFDIGGLFSGKVPLNHLGAELGAPADPSVPFDAARPEWYFLFLFQFLKLWESEFIGAILIPGLVTTVLFLFPITGAWRIGHIFNCVFLTALLAGMLGLTTWALYLDANNANYQAAVRTAHARFERARDLFGRREHRGGGLTEPQMIPRSGAAAMLRDDPLLRGPELFKRQCASCHPYYDPADPFSLGTEEDPRFPLVVDVAAATARAESADGVAEASPSGTPLPGVSLSAPNLWKFGSRAWIAGLLDPEAIDRVGVAMRETAVPTTTQPLAEAAGASAIVKSVDAVVDAPYFGNTNLRDGRMSEWVKTHVRRGPDGTTSGEGAPVDPDRPRDTLSDADVADIAAALSAQARLPYQRDLDAADGERIGRGNALIRSTCATWCHRYGEDGQLGLGPDLTGYGSYEWMVGMVGNPGHVRYYRNENDRMPAFAPSTTDLARNQLSPMEVSMIVDWLRGEYYRPGADRPVLSHTDAQAAQAHQEALKTEDPPPVVGARPDAAATLRRRAEALFTVNCATCHPHVDTFGRGLVADEIRAPNLHGFASREWLAGLLDPEAIATVKYFGATHHADGEMVAWVQDNLTDLDEETAEALAKAIAALSAESALPAQAEADEKAADDGTLEEGKAALVDTFACTDCHAFGDDGDIGTGAPTLTGWGSADWLKRFIAAPDDDAFYGDNNDRMPRFRRADVHKELSILTEEELDLIVRLIRGESFDAPSTVPRGR